MSSPIDRPSDTDGISRYAPKWARDVDNLLQQHLARPHVRTASGTNTASLVPADSPEYDPSLAPITMPEPPVPEPWLRIVGRTLLRGGGRMAVIVPILVAIVLSALIALVIVVVWPSIWSIAAKQLSTESELPPAAKSSGARFDGELPRVAASPKTIASEPRPASAAHPDSAQRGADPWVAAVNPAVAPAARPSPFTLSDIATPALAHPAPVTSPPPTNPTPAVIAPPADNAAPRAAPVPVTIVKTVPVEREKPVRPLGSEEIETLLKQGDDFMMVGDFVSARLVYRRVAEAMMRAEHWLSLQPTTRSSSLRFTPRVRPLTSQRRANGTPRREISARLARRPGWRRWQAAQGRQTRRRMRVPPYGPARRARRRFGCI